MKHLFTPKPTDSLNLLFNTQTTGAKPKKRVFGPFKKDVSADRVQAATEEKQSQATIFNRQIPVKVQSQLPKQEMLDFRKIGKLISAKKAQRTAKDMKFLSPGKAIHAEQQTSMQNTSDRTATIDLPEELVYKPQTDIDKLDLFLPSNDLRDAAPIKKSKFILTRQARTII